MKRIIIAMSTVILCSNSINVSAASIRLKALQHSRKFCALIVAGTITSATAKKTVTWKDFVGEDGEMRPYVYSEDTVQSGEHPLPANITLKTRNGSPLKITDGTGYEYWKGSTIGKKLWTMNEENTEASRKLTGSCSIQVYRQWCTSGETNITASGEPITEQKDFPINTTVTLCERTSEGKHKCIDAQAKGDLIDIHIENLSPNETNSSETPKTVRIQDGCRIRYEEKFTTKDYEEEAQAEEARE